MNRFTLIKCIPVIRMEDFHRALLFFFFFIKFLIKDSPSGRLFVLARDRSDYQRGNVIFPVFSVKKLSKYVWVENQKLVSTDGVTNLANLTDFKGAGVVYPRGFCLKTEI